MGLLKRFFPQEKQRIFERNVIFPFTAYMLFAPIKEGTVVAVNIKLPLQNKIWTQWRCRGLIFVALFLKGAYHINMNRVSTYRLVG